MEREEKEKRQWGEKTRKKNRKQRLKRREEKREEKREERLKSLCSLELISLGLRPERKCQMLLSQFLWAIFLKYRKHTKPADTPREGQSWSVSQEILYQSCLPLPPPPV